MLVFIGAIRREIAGLEPLVSNPETERFGSSIVMEGTADGRPVALVRSGIGRERSEAAFRDLLLAEVRPRAIVSLGFAGGVAPDVYGGDLVVPRTIRGLDYSGAIDGAIAPDPYLFDSALEALEDEFIAVHTDEVVTVPQTLFTLEQKEQFASSPRTKAVDMECYWVGKLALEARIPFLAVRAISDETEDALPNFSHFLDDMGEVRPLAAARYYATHPWHIFDAPRLAGNARKGARNLAVFGEAFVKKVYRAAPVAT